MYINGIHDVTFQPYLSYKVMTCNKNSHTVPQLQKKQWSTLWSVQSESGRTERHSAHLRVAAWTCGL